MCTGYGRSDEQSLLTSSRRPGLTPLCWCGCGVALVSGSDDGGTTGATTPTWSGDSTPAKAWRDHSTKATLMLLPPRQQIPGVYHRRIGDVVVTALSDGYIDVPYEVMNIRPGDADAILAGNFRPTPPRIAVNAFLIYSAGRVALIETGSGTSMGPTLGRLPESLAAAGVTPEQIDAVLLTHMHPDHSNGLVDDNGRLAFPSAELVVHEDEISHWLDDGRMAEATERQRMRYFAAARRQLAPYRNRLRTFRAGEIFPGVTAMS